MADLVVGVDEHVRRVVSLFRLADMARDSGSPNLEPVAYAFMVSGPAVRNNELVRRVILQQDSRATVAERLLDVTDDLLQENLKIQD
jgi:hypothetical protein